MTLEFTSGRPTGDSELFIYLDAEGAPFCERRWMMPVVLAMTT
jgi:hypothetical protein